MCAVLPIIVQSVNNGVRSAARAAGLGTMRGGIVVGQTVQPVQAWKTRRLKLYD